jgi:hypothetical protein
MKKFISVFYLSLLLILNGCNKKDQSGYNCLNGTCSAALENAQYLSLADCQSVCGNFNNATSGYNCVSGNCVSVSNNAQYSNLSACQTDCANNSPGSVVITASWSLFSPWDACGVPFTVVIGLGYNSTDITNESYFASNSFIYSPASFSKNGLAPGTYYYKAKKTYNINTCGCCGGESGPPPTVTKSGAFTIIAGQNINVNAGSLN